MGDIQFSLLMDVLSQNYEEGCSFIPDPVPAVRPGCPLPMAASLPESLGILESEVPTMEVSVRFVECSFLFETPIPQTASLETLGVGRKEAEMFLSDAALTYVTYNTGSSRLSITSSGVILNDIRTTQDDGACISILVVEPRAGQDGQLLQQITNASASRWEHIWNSIKPSSHPRVQSSDALADFASVADLPSTSSTTSSRPD